MTFENMVPVVCSDSNNGLFDIPADLLDRGAVEKLLVGINAQFNGRAIMEPRKRGIDYGVCLATEIVDKVLNIRITRGENAFVVNIPLPFQEGAVTLLKQNGVYRAVCNFYFIREDYEISYLEVIHRILFDHIEGVLPYGMIKKKTDFVQRIAYSFENETTSVVMYQLQRAINEVVNRMPLHETQMNSWAMNQRLMIIDPTFDEIQDPKARLEYQIKKATILFGRHGWTPIGLSDGVLSDRNYVLKADLRRTVPFGRRMHNPARNLYSTLGMRGDEDPLVRSETGQWLMDNGVGRKGWNFLTLFVDVPDVWEDQIVVNAKHANKSVTYSRRIQCFGKIQVREGEKLTFGKIICIAEDKEPTKCDIMADRVWVEEISQTETNVGSAPIVVNNVIVKFTRKFKDGVKITNCAANKGVIRLVDNLGVAIDPRTGEEREIDVIVSSKAVKKRKNYSQILEALSNNVKGETVQIYPDDVNISVEAIEAQLEAAGFPKSGEWACNTAYGELTGICGLVFWGVTHDVEDMLWDENDTIRRNGREIRVAGLKFSHVEFRALITRFGPDNPILDELMSYAQGGEDINEMLQILEAKRGNLPNNKPVVDARNILPVNQSGSTITSKSAMEGTIADENQLNGGFILKLPVQYLVVIGRDVEQNKPYVTLFEGWPTSLEGLQNDSNIKEVHLIDKIYVPHINLRRPWRHPSGKYGLTDVAAALNNIVIMCHRHFGSPDEMIHIEMLYRAIARFFRSIAGKMGSKRGELSVHGMSIRYPFSSKAVATLSNSLPKNVVQIHSSMAKCLHIREGDIVLVERFPCLGFMSLRPQKVTITDDKQCKYTIRVSKNSLGSLSLDFDGDVIYLASFHNPKSKEMLRKEWTNPNKTCIKAIQQLNNKMGVPRTKMLTLQEYGVTAFEPLTAEEHAEIVSKLTGVKSHTGPVIALAYNIMRLVENSDIKDSKKMQVAVEMFLDRVGNSVFKQKHGVKSLHDIVIDAICSGDVETLVEHEFDRGTSTIICNTIRQKALTIGVSDLAGYHDFIKRKGGSNIINRLVREQNKVYFASRAQLEACELLKHLEEPAVDVPSRMLEWIRSGRAEERHTFLEDLLDEKALATLKTERMKGACKSIMDCLDELFAPVPTEARLPKFPKLSRPRHLSKFE